LTQYVQIVNEGYQVFNKATGASVLGPSGISSIWGGFGGVCENNGDGDPVVVYDQIANRWVISQFAGAGTPTDECIAVSTGSDATGSYNRYGFHLGSNFFDYPKLGVWPDPTNNGYFMSDNVFNAAGTAFLGVQAFAFDRVRMLAGLSATFVTSGLIGSPANNGDPLLPADLDGSTLPPANSPCPFVEFPDTTGNNAGTYRTWLFHPDFVTPAMSTFTQRTSPTAAAFSFACTGGRTCVPQPAGTALDGIGDRLMHRLPYRIIGGVERVVGNFTVSSGGVTGVRWFELRNVTSGSESVFQESTYQPDSTWRWMGSIAQDQAGDMALGFSASSATVFPSVRYAGRLIGDPVGTLGQGEATLFAGLGSQTGTGSRWGDYSAMSIDPVDDCTFWYTQEYYPAGTTSFNWRTRIGNFKFPTCNGAATPVITSAGATLVSESCTPANGVLDPGETVTVSFCVQNVGSGNTTALMGTLQSTGGVTNVQPPNPQNYGVVVAGGPPVCRNFTFTAAGTCGGTVTATIHFQDGATDLGNVTYTFTMGTQSIAFTENFDGVTAPALPAGWVSNTTNGDADCTVGGPLCTLGTQWTTVSGSSDTAPNHAFHNDPSCVTDSTLDTPSIAIPASATQLTFKNFYNTESTFDGGVLEISINGGAFTDIVTAGGSFVTGGYNATISTTFLSPIAGRMAWSGNSGGFITTTANLPAAAQGMPIKLRFRMASDCSVSATGWNIDTIKITGGFVCATCPAGTPCVITCPANITKSNDPNQCGAVVTYPPPTSTGTCGTITCTPASGSFFPVGTTTVTCQAATGGGGTLPPGKDAPTACSTITQSSSQAITSGNSVSCNNGVGHTDNSYYRAFTLASFGISGAWDVQSVDIGVELASAGVAAPSVGGKAGFSKSSSQGSGGVKAPNATQPISVKLYTSSMPFPAGFPGSLTLIGQTDTTVADQSGTIINIPVTGTAPAGSQLVVEVFTPDGEAAGNLFFIGSNAAAETGPSYLRAPACGVTNPTTTAAIGFPNMHIVMNVNGCTQVVGTGPTCTFTVTVNDTQPPTITCPANIVVAAAATCPPAGSRTVNYTVTASDNCPGVTVVCTPPSGSVFPVGTTTVNCTATDAHGNTASCSFTVTVFTACLVDESIPGNVVLFNAQTGGYRFCCGGVLQATGTGVLTLRGCIGTIDDLKGNRKVHIEFDLSAGNGAGKGTASIFLNGSTNPTCKITDQNMSNNSCTCPTSGGTSPVLK
jgi:HYR domain-containing protein